MKKVVRVQLSVGSRQVKVIRGQLSGYSNSDRTQLKTDNCTLTTFI
jgi:hypothetical protein